MHSGKYVFTQLIEFLPQKTFQRIVMRYQGDKYIKSFSCWNQLLVMMFGQLSGLNNKDGKFAWRPLQLINPALYVYLVFKITYISVH